MNKRMPHEKEHARNQARERALRFENKAANASEDQVSMGYHLCASLARIEAILETLAP